MWPSELQRDVAALKERGAADDIVQATCAKLVARARESLARRDSASEFAARHLEMTRNSLVTAYRQVRARLSACGRVAAGRGASSSFGARASASARL